MVSHLGSHKHERPHITCRFRKGMIASDSSAVFPCKSSRIRACWHNPPVLAPPVLACQEFFRKLTPQIVQKTLAWSMSQRLLERMESIVHMRDHPGLPIFPFGQLPNNLHCQNPPCSEQVHLQLGGPNEMVVSFVSSVWSPTRSRVIYSEQLDQGCNRTKLLQNATGTTQQYSHLMYFSRHLVEPGMGKPTLTLEELAKIRSTEWCQDASTGWKYPCYHSFTAEDASRLYGGGRYYNFRDNYDSPNIHTVVLKGLAPNQSYCYSVDNDERVFSFKMPADRVLFPFKLGLRPGSVQSCSSFFRASLKNPMRPCVPHQRSQVIIAPHVFLQPRSDSLAFRPQQQSTSNSGSQKWWLQGKL